jgi:hypothetical protein
MRKIESKLVIIENLREIYKLDFKHFLTNVVDKDNFVGHYSLIEETFESLKSDVNKSSNSESRQLLVSVSDKLLKFSLSKLFVDVTGSQFVVDSAQLDFNSSNLNNDVINFVRLCSPFCSANTCMALFKTYIVYITKIMAVNKLVYSSYSVLNSELGLKEKFYSTNNSEGSGGNLLEIKQVNFLLNFFNLIASNNLKSIDFEAIQPNKKLLEILIDASLFTLHKLNDNNLLSKLCINTLTKLGYINKSIRNTVLVQVYAKLKENLLGEVIYENVNQTSVSYSNESKKRLESFVQDLDLNLLASLGDHIAESALESISNDKFINYLTKSEYWHLIQTCLAHTNSLSRKQALYLLKRSIDIALVNKLEINSSYHDTFTVIDNNQNDIVQLNGESKSHVKAVNLFQATWPAWNDYFLCIELLEETSVHVIKPVLCKVNNIIDAIKSNQFHYSWLFVLISRAFLHESKFIVRWAVSTFLQFDLSELTLKTTRDGQTANRDNLMLKINGFIFGPFMLIMQKFYLYHK